MARTHVKICLPDGRAFPVRTDLHGRGSVKPGEEFLAREVWTFASGNRLMIGGRKVRVRVLRVEEVAPRCPVVFVEVLQVLA